MALKAPAPEAVEIAIASIGRGYNMSTDLRLKYCKGESHTARLIEIDDDGGREIILPGGITIPNREKRILKQRSKSSKLIKGIFERFNRDRSGFIDANELRDALLSLPKEKSKSNDQAAKREKKQKTWLPTNAQQPKLQVD
ncbi:hypothetical protein ACFX13_022462 [Malus domestica]